MWRARFSRHRLQTALQRPETGLLPKMPVGSRATFTMSVFTVLCHFGQNRASAARHEGRRGVHAPDFAGGTCARADAVRRCAIRRGGFWFLYLSTGLKNGTFFGHAQRRAVLCGDCAQGHRAQGLPACTLERGRAGRQRAKRTVTPIDDMGVKLRKRHSLGKKGTNRGKKRFMIYLGKTRLGSHET